ncbi:MAG: GNAT family N-acetyltransferase [Alphaproteobacteria bacterium]|nr:GNAT family N-acetyltransferase [Alphaproteobacteria bacterium]
MINEPHLIIPDIRYKDSYVKALRGGLETIAPSKEKLQEIENDFKGYIKREHDLSIPIKLLDGSKVKKVPHTELWLVSKDRFLGRISIRHKLSEFLRQVGGHIGYAIRKSERRKGYGKLMLKSALLRTKALGLDQVLITCNKKNIGSIKIIEGAGGILKKPGYISTDIAGKPVLLRHYWVEL